MKLTFDHLRGELPAAIHRSSVERKYRCTCHVCGDDHEVAATFLRGVLTDHRGREYVACDHHSGTEVRKAYRRLMKEETR